MDRVAISTITITKITFQDRVRLLEVQIANLTALVDTGGGADVAAPFETVSAEELAALDEFLEDEPVHLETHGSLCNVLWVCLRLGQNRGAVVWVCLMVGWELSHVMFGRQ